MPFFPAEAGICGDDLVAQGYAGAAVGQRIRQLLDQAQADAIRRLGEGA